METVGWLIWGIVLFFAMCGVYFLYVSLKQGVQAQTVSIIINQWILVGWTLYFPDLNKLHLLWLAPLTFVWGIAASPFLLRGKWSVLWAAIGLNVALLWFLT